MQNLNAQELDFLKSINEYDCDDYESDDVDGEAVETKETIQNFVDAAYSWRGNKIFKSKSGLEIFIIKEFQRFKGDERRTIFIADFGDKRLVLA